MTSTEIARLLPALEAATGYPWRPRTIGSAEYRVAPYANMAPASTPRVSVACWTLGGLSGQRRVVVRWRGPGVFSPPLRTKILDIPSGRGWAERAAAVVALMLAEESKP
jgi:hypothetical protein